MKKFGRDMEFISQINRDGSGTSPVKESYVELMQKDEFEVHRLSITEDTYIAHGFNAFVVKIKK